MRIRVAALSIILLFGFRAFSQQGPVADHHQHLGSPEIVKLAATSTRPPVPISAKDVVAQHKAKGKSKKEKVIRSKRHVPEGGRIH